DLAGAEALGDLINAGTEEQRAQSVRLMDGALHRRCEAWRDDLLRAVALIEVTIDWADEEVPEDVVPEVSQLVGGLIASMADELGRSDMAERIRTGFEIALLGAPNVGKSSLFNYLADREAAITSPDAGTTRDVLELQYDLRGIPVTFLDMAGLRASDDPVEQEGVRRALDRGRSADLRLRLTSADAPFPDALADPADAQDVVVSTKSDIGAAGRADTDFDVSTVTGEGIAALTDAIFERLRHRVDRAGLLGHARQRAAAADAIRSLEAAQNRLHEAPVEIVAEDLRAALGALGRLTGGTDVEAVLGEVFSRFCLGK
ncbi:MAG: GTPase, partial [Pseudomonadota bacterium]